MPAKKSAHDPPPFAEWPLVAAATLGSAVRVQGIEREIRARLPWPLRRSLTVETGRVVLHKAEGHEAELPAAASVVAKALEGIEALPILPREVEDILTISSHERHKWTKDGRLKSAGTRTVKLRGRAKAVTFHVFDPREIEDTLDRDLPSLWREEDVLAKAESRRRAAGKAARTRAGKTDSVATPVAKTAQSRTPQPKLKGWDAFDTDGLLR